MSIALITAGGKGTRTGNIVPKQYLTVYDVPIILYTMLSVFESGCYDEMYVICSDGWKDFIHTYAHQYKIDIFKNTITAGDTRFGSFSNGIKYIFNEFEEDQIITILDGNRPLISKKCFEESTVKANNYDCVITIEPCYDSMFIVLDKEKQIINEDANRDVLFKGQGLESFHLYSGYEICENAIHDKLTNMTMTSLMLHYKKNVSYTMGSSLNFKITTQDDINILKAIIKSNDKFYNIDNKIKIW